MKNYEKLYKKLIKEIKDMQKEELSYDGNMEDNEIMKAVECRASNYAGHCLGVVLEIADEIEGKKWHNMIMNQKEFNKNKARIK